MRLLKANVFSMIKDVTAIAPNREVNWAAPFVPRACDRVTDESSL